MTYTAPNSTSDKAATMITAHPSPRRQFLFGLGCFTASVTAARPSSAFQVLPSGDYTALVDQSCGVTTAHRRLLDEAKARLGVTLTDAQTAETLAALRCPICGCPLIATADSSAPSAATPTTEAVHEQ